MCVRVCVLLNNNYVFFSGIFKPCGSVYACDRFGMVPFSL